MTVQITHSKVATLPDQPGVEINKGEWNDFHSVAGLAAVASSGAYIDLTGKPTLGTLAGLNAADLAANVTGILPFANGGTNNNATPGAGTLSWSDGSKLTSDANLTWSTTTGLLTQKGISSKGAANGTGTELFGLGASDASTLATTNNTLVGANAKQTTNFGFETNNTGVGANVAITGNNNLALGSGISINGSSVVAAGAGAGSNSNFSVSIGASASVTAGNSIGAIGAIGAVTQSNNGGMMIGRGYGSVRDYELAYGWVDSAANAPGIRLFGSTGAFVSRDTARFATSWIDSTDATRKARIQFFVEDTAEEEFMRADANGGGVDLYLNANTSPLSAAGFSLGTAALPWKQLFVDFTNSATVGSVTINKASGTVNMAALGSTLTVTNSLVTANSRIIPALSSDPGVALSIWCVGGAGSFTVNTRPAVVNQTAIDFVVFP